jgi:hypothetical protein
MSQKRAGSSLGRLPENRGFRAPNRLEWVTFVEFNRLHIATKERVWDELAAWLERFGIDPRAPVEVIDSDITVLMAAADKVNKVGGPKPYAVIVELQSSHDST